jgi:DNA-binding CsgD family transcriptional regulator
LNLAGLAYVVGAEGQALVAARLRGEAEAIMEAIGYRPEPQQGAMIELHRASSRSRLGDVAWEEALAEGRAMGPDRVIEYALSEEDSTTHQAPNREAAGARALHLMPREEEVATMVAQGLTNRQIAVRLVISEATAETHLSRIFKKLGRTPAPSSPSG